MKNKSNPPKSQQRGFNAERFWRHYVAAVESDDASWSAEQTKGGNAGRIFMFLLLFHVFLIGAAVLFNVVAERPRPEFVDSTKPVPKATAPTQKVTQNEKPKAPPAVPVVSRPNTVAITVSATDTLKSIADKAGATPAEIAQLNRIDPNTQVAPGSTLQVPTGRTAVVQAAKVHHVTVAAQAMTNVPKAGAAEAFQATQPPTSISNPKPADAAPPSKVPTVADKLPRDTVKAKIPEADTPPAPKPAAAPAIAKESESQKVAPAKVTPVEKTAPAKTVTESRTHTVKPKDTFYSISRKYHVPVKELMRINGVTDPGRLREGTVLKIPAK